MAAAAEAKQRDGKWGRTNSRASYNNNRKTKNYVFRDMMAVAERKQIDVVFNEC